MPLQDDDERSNSTPEVEPKSQPALGLSNRNKRIRETTIENLLGTPSPSPVRKKNVQIISITAVRKAKRNSRPHPRGKGSR